MNTKMINAMINNDAKKRYEYLIKKVADNESLYSLYNDGWALYSDKEKTYFPIWSEKEFAELCIKDDFLGHKATEIALEDVLNELLPNLKRDHIELAIFPTPDDLGICIDCDIFKQDIDLELENY